MRVETFTHLKDEDRDAHLHLGEGDLVQHASGEGPLYVVVKVEPNNVRAMSSGKPARIINIANWRRVSFG